MNSNLINKTTQWVKLYGYQPSTMPDDISNTDFVLFVNQLYLDLLKGKVKDNFATQGFNYDPAIKNSFDFYCANQKHLRSLAIMGGE
jgi:hypothetical protein